MHLKDTHFYDEKVTAGKEYEYRVSAINEEGEGEHSDASVTLPAKPEKEKPKFDRSDIYGPVKEIKLKAGDPINIDLKIDGSPQPAIILTKNGIALPKNNPDG